MGTDCSGKHLVSLEYLPHTWCGEANLEEYYKTWNEVEKNIRRSNKIYISSIFAGMVAKVEVKPHQEPFVGGGTRVSRGNGAKWKANLKVTSRNGSRRQACKHVV